MPYGNASWFSNELSTTVYSLNLKNASFFSQSLDILGHHITDQGGSPSLKGIEAITRMPTPKNATEVKRFLGLTGYFRDYINNMACNTVHLRNLLQKGTLLNGPPITKQSLNT